MSVSDFGHFYGRPSYVLDAVTLAQIEAIRVQREADQMLELGYEPVDLLVWLETHYGVVVHRTTLSRAIDRWKAEDAGKGGGLDWLFAQGLLMPCVFRRERVLCVCIYYRGFTCSFVFFILVRGSVHYWVRSLFVEYCAKVCWFP